MVARRGLGTKVNRMRARLSFSRWMIVLVGLVVAACSSTVEREPIPALTYGHLPPIEVLVARVEVIDEYQSPLREPNVEHTFPMPPAAAFRQWVEDRLRGVGQNNTLRITIIEASALRVPLPRTEGVEGLFTTDQVERIDATVLLEIVDNGGLTAASISARTQRSRSMAEGLSLDERDKFFQELSEALVNDLNATIEQNMRQNLAGYLAS